MKTKGKAWHLIATVLLIVVFVYTAFFGVYAKYGDTTTTYIKGAKDIRFGVDIKGGVNVTFVPSDGYDATEEQLEAAQLVIENRLVALNVTDYELYVDNNSDSLILEFPWQSGETDFDPEAAIDEIGTTAYLTFREGSSADGELILDGSMIESAAAQYGPVSNGGASEYFVSLKFTDDGAKAFGDATTKLAASGGTISIWLDDENVSTATVNTAITDGSAIITSSASNPFTQEQVVKMARQINSGALPFALTVDSYSTVSPSLGENSLSAMVLAGLIAFALIVVFMTMLYRLPGFLACIALAGQVAATLAFVSGYFPVFESFTMTLPGIAGIILAIGMGVDANVITAERIKEELKNGKSLDGALKSGFARGLTPIVDGNVTIVIVAIVLMGAFGPSDGMLKGTPLCVLCLWPLHRRHYLCLRLHAAHRRAAELCVWRVCNPCDDPRCGIHQGTAQPLALRCRKARQGKSREEAHRLCGPAQAFPDDLLLPDGNHRAVRCGFGCPSGYRVHRRCHDHPELRGQLYHVGCAEGCILCIGE